MNIDNMTYTVKEVEVTGQWQTSDKANKRVVTSCTELCRERYAPCRLSVRYKGGTLLATRSYYNAYGILVEENPNTSHYEVCCGVCWRQWEVNQQPNYGNKE